MGEVDTRDIRVRAGLMVIGVFHGSLFRNIDTKRDNTGCKPTHLLRVVR